MYHTPNDTYMAQNSTHDLKKVTEEDYIGYPYQDDGSSSRGQEIYRRHGDKNISGNEKWMKGIQIPEEKLMSGKKWKISSTITRCYPMYTMYGTIPSKHGNRYVLLLAWVTGATETDAKITAPERGKG